MAISHCYWYLVVKYGNFTLLLISFSQEWPFHIATDTLWSRMTISHTYWYVVSQERQFHIATDILWSRMAISHCYWHLVVKNDNFTYLLTSSGQEWKFHIATNIWWSRLAIGGLPADLPLQMYHWIYIMGCIRQPFCILQEKVRISFYFWIIRVVNCQLTLNSHVRGNPLDTT